MAEPSTPWMTEGKILFLTLEEVLTIYQDQVGGPVPNDRQLGHLRACLAMPATKQGGSYSHRDLFEMAAAYLFHMVHNRPFNRGNGKVGVLAALFFLYLHHIEVRADPDDLAALARQVAERQASKGTVAEFLRSHSRRSPLAPDP